MKTFDPRWEIMKQEKTLALPGKPVFVARFPGSAGVPPAFAF